MECDVCCETMKKEVCCNICGYKACYKCFSKFILECTINPKCMKCDKPWSRKSLVDGFGQYFVSHKYKEKRENVLFDLEKALLPETQPYAVREQLLRKLLKQEETIRNEIRKLHEELYSIPHPDRNSEESIDNYNELRKVIKMEIHSKNEDIDGIHTKRTYFVMKKETTNKSQVVVKCPGENCRGYIGPNMKCEMCSIKLCKQCHHVKTDEEHTCKEDDVNTVKLLLTNTKNCPSCKALIYKIDGCDQMYCTNCHTAFSWRTCEIVHGKIHNPHYYEYMRLHGNQEREIGDIPCGGIPRFDKIMKKFGYNTKLGNIHRLCTHIEFVEVPYYSTNVIENNRDLRISYLLGDITLDMFKHNLQKREKAINKKREISTVLNTFLVVASDILQRSITENITEDGVISEFQSIRNYTNNLMKDVSRIYTCVTPIIDDFWNVHREKA